MRVDLFAVYRMDRSRIGKKYHREHNEDAEDSPLCLQKRHRSVGNMACELLHCLVTGILLADPSRLKCHHDQTQYP